MVVQYLGSNIHEITTTQGTTITITTDEWNELADDSPMIEELNERICNLKDEVCNLEDEVRQLELLVEDLEKTAPDNGQAIEQFENNEEGNNMKNQEAVYAGIKVAMGAARQLIKGTGADRLAWMKHNLPQRIENGVLINYAGEEMGESNLPDQEFAKAERLTDAKVITDALMSDLFTPLNQTIFAKTAPTEKADEPEDSPECEAAVEEGQVTDDEIIKKLEKAIKKGKAEKAAELLDELKPCLDKKQFKTYKKQIKGL